MTPYTSDEPMRETTEDFVEAFADQSEFSGAFFGFMHSSRILPNGIDVNDQRVQAILRRLDQWKATV